MKKIYVIFFMLSCATLFCPSDNDQKQTPKKLIVDITPQTFGQQNTTSAVTQAQRLILLNRQLNSWQTGQAGLRQMAEMRARLSRVARVISR